MPGVSSQRNGLFSFAIAMIASVISATGSKMTLLAVIIWAWQQTGSTAVTGLVSAIEFGAIVVVSVFAGALVDRWKRKLAIISTDTMGAIASAGILSLFSLHILQIWALVVLAIVLGVLESFQFPAYLASITLMVPEEQRGQANGMYQLAWALSEVVSAALAGVLYAGIGLSGILIIDVATFVVIITVIALLHIPQPAPASSNEQNSFWQDILYGFHYILKNGGILWMVLIFASINVAFGAYQGLFRPMVLALTSNNEATLGFALAAAGFGAVAGGLLTVVWKGPANKIRVTLLSWIAMSFFGCVIVGLGRSLLIWSVALFFEGALNMIALSTLFAFLQQKVEQSVQGRVFSIIRFLVQGTIPISALLLSQLSNHLVEPAMQPAQSLAVLFGWMVGTGKGAAMSLIIVIAGVIFGIGSPVLGLFSSRLRGEARQSALSSTEQPFQEKVF